MSRVEILAKAYLDYHAGKITLAELQAVIREWRR